MSRLLCFAMAVGVGALAVSASAVAAPPRELAVYWPTPPDANEWKLLRQLDATAVLMPLSVRKPELAGIALIAEIKERPLEETGEDLALARKLGYDGAAIYATGEEAAFGALLRKYGNFVQFVFLSPKQAGWRVAPARAVLLAGLWPGLQAADTATAAATEKPWINANLHLYAWLRAFYPERPAWLRTPEPKPDTRYDSAEVALAEAFAGGGHALLQLPEMYRAGLRQGTPRALQSWNALSALARALRGTGGFEAVAPAGSTAIVTGDYEEFEELLNLPFRDNLSPRVLPAGRPARLQGTRVLVAVNQSLDAAQAREAIAFTRAGGILVASPESTGVAPWLSAAQPRKIRDEKPWSLWELGAGRVYLYPELIIDPSEFAYDLREISGQDNPRHTGLNGLDFRVWNAPTVLGTLYEGANGGKRLVLISYGQGMNRDFLIGVRGTWASGVLRQPGADGQKLELMQRGWFAEANLKAAGRVAIVELEGKQP
jgi:hypothetical protein